MYMTQFLNYSNFFPATPLLGNKMGNTNVALVEREKHFEEPNNQLTHYL